MMRGDVRRHASETQGMAFRGDVDRGSSETVLAVCAGHGYTTELDVVFFMIMPIVRLAL